MTGPMKKLLPGIRDTASLDLYPAAFAFSIYDAAEFSTLLNLADPAHCEETRLAYAKISIFEQFLRLRDGCSD